MQSQSNDSGDVGREAAGAALLRGREFVIVFAAAVSGAGSGAGSAYMAIKGDLIRAQAEIVATQKDVARIEGEVGKLRDVYIQGGIK